MVSEKTSLLSTTVFTPLLLQTLWVLQNVVSNTAAFENEERCVSFVDAAQYHPSEVPEWQCEAVS